MICSYVIAMEEFYSYTNGIPSATNGPCVLIDETQNVTFTNRDQEKNSSPVSVTSSLVGMQDSSQDIADADVGKVKTGRRKSIVSISDINLKPSKLVLIIGLCCVIGLSLPPVIIFYVPIDTSSGHNDANTSQNFSMVHISNILYMYKFLRELIFVGDQNLRGSLFKALFQRSFVFNSCAPYAL